MRIILTVTVFLFHFAPAFAQGLTGIWKGHFIAGADGYSGGSQYKYEVQFLDKGGKLEGVTYSYLDTRFYGKAAMDGSYNSKAAQVILRENKLIEIRSMGGSTGCRMTCYLHVVRSGNEIFLEGTYTSISDVDSSDCGRGTVILRKVVFSDFGKEPFLNSVGRNVNGAPDPRDRKPEVVKRNPAAASNGSTAKATPNNNAGKPAQNNTINKKTATPPQPKQGVEPAKTNAEQALAKAKPVQAPNNQVVTNKKVPLSDLANNSFKPDVPLKSDPDRTLLKSSKRENVLLATVTVDHPEVTLKFYDNGEIDNDSISVYRNNQLMLSKQRLSTKPIILKIDLNETGGSADIIMLAENLGTIPPNTALMVVEAGNFRKEVHLTSNLEKNARVLFKLK